ncbi:MAG: glycosyltransferase [candidate division WOR-3 bacterium]|nr:MAG: glycosyltransferase [candidate division WOR-3 bacterium]
MKEVKLRVCYFGTYLRDYPRNKIIIDGLRSNDVEVIECHVDLWKGIEPRWREIKSFFGKIKLAYRMIAAYISLCLMHQEIAGDYDAMVVGYTGHFDIFLARLLASSKRRPLIFDAFVSLYNTLVEDRRLFKPNSLVANILQRLDRFTSNISDAVLLDTHAHIAYFRNMLNVDKTNLHNLWAGADDTVFFPRVSTQKDRKFTVLFIGGFIPLQGVKHIVQAALLLEKKRDIRFRLIGSGQQYEEAVELADDAGSENIEFVGWMPYEILPQEIVSAQVCLGIFGTTEKAKRVIPNKVYMAAAMAKPIITGDSPAMREIFTNKKNILFCEVGNPQAIADSIMLLKNNERLRSTIARGGYMLFRHNFAPAVIGKMAKEIISESMKSDIHHAKEG